MAFIVTRRQDKEQRQVWSWFRSRFRSPLEPKAGAEVLGAEGVTL